MKQIIRTRSAQLRNILFTLLVLGLLEPVVFAAELPNFAELVEVNAPTIVEIATSRQVEARPPGEDRELEAVSYTHLRAHET